MKKTPTPIEIEMSAPNKPHFSESASNHQEKFYQNKNVYSKETVEKYLTLLAESVDNFTFQTFDDDRLRNDKSLVKVLHGTLENHFEQLCELNGKGAGIFVTVNETDLNGRKIENILDVRAIFQEADRQGVPIPRLTPHIVIQTSPGKFHRYWLTHGGGNAISEFKLVMNTMVSDYGSDPNARDLARVLRLPGFYHQKNPSCPFMVQILETSMSQPYTWDQIKEAIPPTSMPIHEPIKTLADGAFKDPLRVRSALMTIDPDCEYQVWISIGMALHHASSGGEEGYSLWDEWSAKGKSYRFGETTYKWQSFGKIKDVPVTIGTLFHFASENGWDWVPKFQRTVIDFAIERVESTISSSKEDPSEYLKDDAIEAFGIVKSCDGPKFEAFRMRLKDANPKIRISALDDYVKKSGFNFQSDNPAEELVQLTCEVCELWHDPDGRCYASFEQKLGDSKHYEHWEINSIGFGEWLARLAHSELNMAPSGETLNTVKNTLNGRAKFDGPEHEVFRRTGKDETGYWIDLGDEHWQAVCVNSAGWRISSRPAVRFTRTKATRSLPLPKKNGSFDPLWLLVNIPIEERPILLAWILECYRCDTPYPVLELTGEQGSAKSSTQTIIRTLIDPNQVMLRGRPKTVEDIYVSAKNNHLLSFENLSNISIDISDALCTVATGGGTAGRTLYTNDEETILEAHNPVILNGIGAIVVRQDLLDRTVGICLPSIEHRRTEQDLKNDTTNQLSTIFGGLLSLFSETLALLPSVEISSKELPRMADFAKLGEAMSRAMGKSNGEWLIGYQNHRKQAIRRTIDSSAVAVQCLKLIEKGLQHQGTVKSLLEKLNSIRENYGEKDYWPHHPRGLADQLRRIAPSLRLLGVFLSVENKPKRDGVHCILKKIEGLYDF